MTGAAVDLRAPLVVGFGVTGQSVTRALLSRGHTPIVIDDRPNDAAIAVAGALEIELIVAPTPERVRSLVESCSVLLPAPGLPDHHFAVTTARAIDRPVRSEFDLARLWDARPLVAITGTNGKTTVTMLVTEALERSGIHAVAVGNTEVPLVESLGDETVDVFVVEASSFRLGHTGSFSPAVATWLNLAPDHLDNHGTAEAYEAAKASIWRNLGPDSVAVGNIDDATVMRHLPPSSSTFGLEAGDWRIENNHLVGPVGAVVAVSDLTRRQPHDLANAAAVAATAFAAGATLEAIAATLIEFAGLEHRVQLVGEWDGVAWYNDSKATVPHATLAAVGGFDSVVLIAGGRNKGLDLSGLADAVPPVKAVVVTGDAAGEIAAVFASAVEAGMIELRWAGTMAEAVAWAAELAVAGDAVVLSPSCTSYDWYANYGERGHDFMRLVNERRNT